MGETLNKTFTKVYNFLLIYKPIQEKIGLFSNLSEKTPLFPRVLFLVLRFILSKMVKLIDIKMEYKLTLYCLLPQDGVF